MKESHGSQDERQWETKDLDDLKRLVRLTVNWIESAVLTKAYIAEMDKAK